MDLGIGQHRGMPKPSADDAGAIEPDLLASWTRSAYTAAGATHDIYRKGSGPGVIVIHEAPGLIPEVIAFGEEVVAAGFTVVMPVLFGTPGRPATPGHFAAAIAQICVSREFTVLATGKTAPIASWLRALARHLHDETGGPDAAPGVGVVGMCFTGGYALAMMVDAPVVAPVLSQPANPAPLGSRRAADLGLSPQDLAIVRDKVDAGCPVLGLRYVDDPAVGTRFDTLRRELGANFTAVEFPGRKHSVLTVHRQQDGVDRVLAFLHDRLSGGQS